MKNGMLLWLGILQFTVYILVACHKNVSGKTFMDNSGMTRSLSEDFTPIIFNAEGDYAVMEDLSSYRSFQRIIWKDMDMHAALIFILEGGESGLDNKSEFDQYLHIESGHGKILIGENKEYLSFVQPFGDSYDIFIPAGKWHNIVNTGPTIMKLYSIYALPEHPREIIFEKYKEIIQNDL